MKQQSSCRIQRRNHWTRFLAPTLISAPCKLRILRQRKESTQRGFRILRSPRLRDQGSSWRRLQLANHELVHHRQIVEGELAFKVVIAVHTVNMFGRQRPVHEDAA